MIGIITEFFKLRNFGYIINEKKDEYCFYLKDIKNRGALLVKGDQVCFDLYKGHGVRAINVRKNQQA